MKLINNYLLIIYYQLVQQLILLLIINALDILYSFVQRLMRTNEQTNKHADKQNSVVYR